MKDHELASLCASILYLENGMTQLRAVETAKEIVETMKAAFPEPPSLPAIERRSKNV